MQLTIGSRAAATASCSLRSRSIVVPSRLTRAAARTPSAKICLIDATSSRLSSRASRVVATKASGASTIASSESAEPTVEEVMNPRPVLLSDAMPIKQAVHLLLDKDVSGAPVVDAAGKLVGVLSESDLIWKGAGKPAEHWILPPIFIGALDSYVALQDVKAMQKDLHKVLARTVADAMSTQVVSVPPSATMAAAASLMLDKQINLLPVVADDGRVVGVITRHDVLRGVFASGVV